MTRLCALMAMLAMAAALGAQTINPIAGHDRRGDNFDPESDVGRLRCRWWDPGCHQPVWERDRSTE